MTEHDDAVTRLFDRIEPPGADDDFTARVGRQLRLERAWSKARTIAGVCGLALITSMAPLILPLEFMTSYAGMLACSAFAIGGAVWIKLADV